MQKQIDAASFESYVSTNAGRTTPTVLHIVEALGGGVMVAVRDYIRATQHNTRHVVLANRRAGHDTGDFAGVEVLELGRLSKGPFLLRRIRQVVSDVQPDVVHLHSSYSGLLGRLAGLDRSKLVYTPHCYAFERTDCARMVRIAYRIAERAMASRCGTVVAVSEREADLARVLGSGTNVVYVPNVANVRRTPGLEAGKKPFTIAAVGRVMAQKDPSWFANFARELRAKRDDVELVWLGGGDSAQELELRQAGVNVSGWIDRGSLLSRLETSDLYVHSAAWEGAPLSVIEAMTLGLPVVGRDIPALRSMGLTELADSPKSLADRVHHLIESGQMHVIAAESVALAANHTMEAQRNALELAYGPVVGTAILNDLDSHSQSAVVQEIPEPSSAAARWNDLRGSEASSLLSRPARA